MLYTHAFYDKNGDLYAAEVNQYVDTPHILCDIRCNDTVRESMTKYTDPKYGFIWIARYSSGTTIQVTPIASQSLARKEADFEALLGNMAEG